MEAGFTTAEALHDRASKVFVTIPAARNMEAKLIDKDMHYGQFRIDQDLCEMGAKINRILTQPTNQGSFVNIFCHTFDAEYSNSESNFGAVLAIIARLKLSSNRDTFSREQ